MDDVQLRCVYQRGQRPSLWLAGWLLAPLPPGTRTSTERDPVHLPMPGACNIRSRRHFPSIEALLLPQNCLQSEQSTGGQGRGFPAKTNCALPGLLQTELLTCFCAYRRWKSNSQWSGYLPSPRSKARFSWQLSLHVVCLVLKVTCSTDLTTLAGLLYTSRCCLRSGSPNGLDFKPVLQPQQGGSQFGRSFPSVWRPHLSPKFWGRHSSALSSDTRSVRDPNEEILKTSAGELLQ